MISEQELSYILYQLGEDEKPYRAVTPSVVRSSNFAFSTIAHYHEAIKNEKDISIYSRGNNPTVRLLERKLAALQGTEDALVFGSGSGAIAAAVIHCVKAGDHVLCVQHAYSWTYKLMHQTLAKFGVQTTVVDGGDPDAVYAAKKSNTTLLILESPTSQRFELQDVKSLTTWAHSHGMRVVYDNSFGSVLNRKPAEFGVDFICHSATKFTSGHSDVVAGIVCGNARDIRSLFNEEYMTLGAILAPDNAWMLIRSLRTLPMRMDHTARTCHAVVNMLRSDVRIAAVYWPFDPHHPQYALAKEQFDIESPMFSFVIKTESRQVVTAFCESLKVIQIAASWGGHESLVMPMIAFPDSPFPFQQIRLYIGFEDEQTLIADLKQALGKAFQS
jgi:cystathionine beta-lyase/cystathionine gamma-synthase